VVEDGVRNGKAMGLRNLPSKTWQVNRGWVLAAGIAADLAAWSRLLGLYDQDGLKDAEPGHAPLPALEHTRPHRPPRPPADPEDQPRLALEGGVPDLLAAAVRDARARLTSTIRHCHREGGRPGAVGAGARPGRTGTRCLRTPRQQPGTTVETRHRHNQ